MYICSCYHLIFIFRSHRFRNVQVEVLYQRYFLRMNQNNMVSLLGLLICISIMLIVINHLFYSTTQNSIIQMVTLGAFTVMYILLVILMMRCFLNEVYLIIFSYSKLKIITLLQHLKKIYSEIPKALIVYVCYGK